MGFGEQGTNSAEGAPFVSPAREPDPMREPFEINFILPMPMKLVRYQEWGTFCFLAFTCDGRQHQP
jgi:hypothetical protein